MLGDFFLDIEKQTLGGPTVDYYPEDHPLKGQLIFYKDWLSLNPYRKLTDVERWHSVHEALISDFLEANQSAKNDRRIAWEKNNPDKVPSRKKENICEPRVLNSESLTGDLSKALDAMANPERALPTGEVYESPEKGLPYEEDLLTIEEAPDELS